MSLLENNPKNSLIWFISLHIEFFPLRANRKVFKESLRVCIYKAKNKTSVEVLEGNLFPCSKRCLWVFTSGKLNKKHLKKKIAKRILNKTSEEVLEENLFLCSTPTQSPLSNYYLSLHMSCTENNFFVFCTSFRHEIEFKSQPGTPIF